jgi:putative ABC transport system permease protein
MAIMVFSFRVSFEEWLRGVVGADLYVRAAEQGDTGFFTRDDEDRVASLPGVARVEALRYDRLVVGRRHDAVHAGGAPDRCAHALRFPGRAAGAARDRGRRAQGVDQPGGGGPARLEGGRSDHVAGRGTPYEARVAGVVRDYARTWGTALVPLADYRAATGDARVNDLGLHLAPGADRAAVKAALRAALASAPALAIEDAEGLLRRSLEIFDRSFAITYALEAIAIVIGLAGVTSSFAALAWSRRREFGVLRFLGLTRREILRMLALEGAAAGAIGAGLGLAAGIAISAVLVHVVNRQSFHWSLELHWPVGALAIFLAAVIALCAVAARASGAYAVRREAILAVKDDA